MASGLISMKFGLQGINYTPVSACATGNSAIMDAFNYIRIGKAKAFITGGSEAGITPASFGGFAALKAMTAEIMIHKLPADLLIKTEMVLLWEKVELL